MDQRLAGHQPPAHAAGETASGSRGFVRQPQHLEEFVRASGGLRDTEQPGLEFESCPGGEVRIQGEFLWDDSDRGRCRSGRLVDVDASDPCCSTQFSHQPSQDVDKGRLPGAVWSEQAKDSASGNGQAHAPKNTLGGPAACTRIDLLQTLGLDGRCG